MAHHKRKGPKSTRSGCLLCKPYKRQGTPRAQRLPFNQYRKESAQRSAVRDWKRDE